MAGPFAIFLDLVSGFARFSLPADELLARRSRVGGNDIIIAGGDPEAINRLWQQKVSGESDDLSTVWPVIMGVLTEELNLEFVQLKHGLVIKDRGRVINGLNPIMRCTLDGAIADYKGGPAVIDAKFTLGYPMKGESYADVVPGSCVNIRRNFTGNPPARGEGGACQARPARSCGLVQASALRWSSTRFSGR